MISSLFAGDACGNDVLAIDRMLHEENIESIIVTGEIGKGVTSRNAVLWDNMPPLKETDIILYHFATSSFISDKLPDLPGKKVLVYHNVTPPHFFTPYSKQSAMISQQGLDEVCRLKACIDYCIADSDFNKQDLLDIGYHCPIYVCPIVIKFSDYDQPPSKSVIQRYKDGNTVNLIFVGRLAPNKKQSDIIRGFAYYNLHRNMQSRLFLVGSGEKESYAEELKKYAAKLKVDERVVFTGHIPFSEILGYYEASDVFICMSEHEGFCVPLVEAMKFGLPIVAYNSTAIPYTLGGSGIMVDDKSPQFISLVVDYVVKHQEFKNHVISEQSKRLLDFQYDVVKKDFLSILNSITEQIYG